MLTIPQQGPRAKYMLYPYYAVLISTTAGKQPFIQESCFPGNSIIIRRPAICTRADIEALHSRPVYDDPYGSWKEDLDLDIQYGPHGSSIEMRAR